MDFSLAKVRAVMVCVDMGDILALTMPYNRHHFHDVLVVTTREDQLTQQVAKNCKARVHMTGIFTERGASFNKWAALEEGLDRIGRSEWLCLMDCDVLWPKVLPQFNLIEGQLYSPLRRMCLPTDAVPPEMFWREYPYHSLHKKGQKHFSGYSQVFHASDQVLGPPPWHQTDWKHAGGADTYFQDRWPSRDKVRPPFNVLHLGPCGENWYGVGNKKAALDMWRRRRETGNMDEERIK